MAYSEPYCLRIESDIVILEHNIVLPLIKDRFLFFLHSSSHNPDNSSPAI